MSQEKTSVTRAFQPAIDIKICGLVAIFARDKYQCKIGLLKKTPAGHPHKLDVLIEEKDTTGSVVMSCRGNTNATHALTLNTPQGISLRKKDVRIDRSVRPSPTDFSYDSFKWAVSLEGPDFYNKAIGAREGGFFPLLTFDSGELYTLSVSESELETRGPGQSVFSKFGFVAVEIGIYIPLRSGLQATFKNGFQHMFTSRLDRLYEITIDRASHEKPTGVVTDAETYYEDDAIGGRLEESEKIHFQSRVGHKIGPEAACFVAYLDKSDPS